MSPYELNNEKHVITFNWELGKLIGEQLITEPMFKYTYASLFVTNPCTYDLQCIWN